MRTSFFPLAPLCAFIFLSCVPPFQEQRDSIVVLFYNVQALFDGKDDGNEYADYRVKSGWNAELYAMRLDALAEALLAAVPGGPDVAVFAEIENEGVLDDLLARGLKDKGYRFAVAVPDNGSSLRCGLISRLPVLDVRSHALKDPAASVDPDIPARLMLECTLDTGAAPLAILVAHWKSRSEGVQITERERIAYARLMASRSREILLEDPLAELVVMGDFNENPDEYDKIGGRYLTALLPAGKPLPATARFPCFLVARERSQAGLCAEGITLWSPWFDVEGFSYAWQGSRERIDQMLMGPGLLDDTGLSFVDFRPALVDLLLNADGVPDGWNTRTKSGYSDHIPLVLKLKSSASRNSAPRKRRLRSLGCACHQRLFQGA